MFRAIQPLTEAVRLAPHSADAHFLLGMAYLLSGPKGFASMKVQILKILDPSYPKQLADLMATVPG